MSGGWSIKSGWSNPANVTNCNGRPLWQNAPRKLPLPNAKLPSPLTPPASPKEPGFGERHENQWMASESVAKIIVLIMRHCGSGRPQIEQIRNLLDEAVHLCRQRNFLAHGTWWCFNRRTLTVKVRAGVRWEQPELPPENREYTVSDLEKLADQFKDIEAELYKIRRSLEPKMTLAEMRAASSFLRAPGQTTDTNKLY
jgi:hypothetical protein